MATFVCMHGAGGRGSHWDLVAAQLRDRGHEVAAMDLPCDHDVGLDAYADTVIAAIDARAHDPDERLVLVAQSLSGFVAPMVADRVPVAMMILVAAMVPRHGETGMEWWDNTGHQVALAAQDWPEHNEQALFVHDVPPDVLAAIGPTRVQTGRLFEEPWPLDAWPDVPTRFVLCRDDRFFPAGWLRGIVRDRLGIEPIAVPGGHCAYLSQPQALADALHRCWTEDSMQPA